MYFEDQPKGRYDVGNEIKKVYSIKVMTIEEVKYSVEE